MCSLLFIEDEEYLRECYVNFVKKDFDMVFEAKDGKEALEIYNKEKPSILVVDINIPKINGLDVLSKIRENDLNTKVIMLSSEINKEYLLRASELKLTKFLQKPCELEKLKNSIYDALKELENYEFIENKIIKLKENLTWNPKTKELFLKDKQINLSKNEKLIIEFFINNKNLIISYESLLIEIWDEYSSENKNLVKSAIKKLRKKLPENSIQNIYGQGYKFNL